MGVYRLAHDFGAELLFVNKTSDRKIILNIELKLSNLREKNSTKTYFELSPGMEVQKSMELVDPKKPMSY